MADQETDKRSIKVWFDEKDEWCWGYAQDHDQYYGSYRGFSSREEALNNARILDLSIAADKILTYREGSHWYWKEILPNEVMGRHGPFSTMRKALKDAVAQKKLKSPGMCNAEL